MSQSDANRLAEASLARGDVTGWFDELYLAAADGSADVPWDRGEPNRMLVDWAGTGPWDTRAVVVGAGYGHDAEFVASLGYDTTAFDVSPTAIAHAMRLHPQSSVRYVTADLFALPDEWRGAFAFVYECITVQSLPVEWHNDAIDAIASLVAPGGRLLALGMAGVPGGKVAGPPWPLIPAEVDRFAAGELTEVVRDDPRDGWWRAELERR